MNCWRVGVADFGPPLPDPRNPGRACEAALVGGLVLQELHHGKACISMVYGTGLSVDRFKGQGFLFHFCEILLCNVTT